MLTVLALSDQRSPEAAKSLLLPKAISQQE
jgi:hypothetical protein